MQKKIIALHDKAMDWPEDYFASAEQFRHTAESCGAEISSLPIQARGPKNEILAIDVAAFISPDDDYRIILVSGVHGVEGFLGAAVQLQFMQKMLEVSLPDGVGVVMIHAANPWGFAHLRRVDENNIDVNRNFIGQDNASNRVSHPLYAELDPVINARNAPSLSGEIAHWLAAGKQIISRRGIKPLIGPIAQGQYDFPAGLFYGGCKIGESSAHLQELLINYTSSVQRVSVLDIHSGLGPSSVATLIGHCNYPDNTESSGWLEQQLGKPIVSDRDDGNAYNATGTFASWLRQALEHKKLVYLCIEIGTVNPIKVFSALRRENQAHHWSPSDTTLLTHTKQSLLEVFAPSSGQWRCRSVTHALNIIGRCIDLPSGN